MKFIRLLGLFAFLSIHFVQADTSIQAVVLAAGSGSRFKTSYSKLTAPICGQPMIVYTAKLLQELELFSTFVVGHQKEHVKQLIEEAQIPELTFVVQEEPLGTGHALLCSQSTWQTDNILVMNGDMPLVTKEIIQELIKQHTKYNAAISFVVSHCVDPSTAYGRVVTENNIMKIIEAKHFTYDINQYPHINAGIYLINRGFLEEYLSSVGQNDVTHEFYITDLVEIASTHSLPVTMISSPYAAIHGVNTLEQLAKVETFKKNELLRNFMKNGVRFINPDTAHVDIGVTIGPDTIIGAGVHLLNGTTVGQGCTIGSYAILDGATIEDGEEIKPHTVAD